jgi:hypothetical protein
MDSEPIITINGQQLTESQALTVRVACGQFEMGLQLSGLGNDATGQAIAYGYLARLKEIKAIMFSKPRQSARSTPEQNHA